MDKIETLIDALADACEENGSSLVVGVCKEYELTQMNFVGHTDEMALINMVAAETICDLIDAKGCDCEGCKQAKKLLKHEAPKKSTNKKPHIHIVDMMGEDADITSVLEQIFGGGKRDDD